MKLLGMVLALLLTGGCAPTPPVFYTVKGTVRSVWCHPTVCDIVFHHDTNETTTIRTGDSPAPPVWKGEHCIMVIRKDPNLNVWDEIVSTQELP